MHLQTLITDTEQWGNRFCLKVREEGDNVTHPSEGNINFQLEYFFIYRNVMEDH